MPPKNRVGLSFGAFWTRLRFDDGDRSFEESALGASYERRLTPRVTLQGSLGGILSGTLSGLSGWPGAFAGVGGSYSVLEQSGAIPFVMLSGALSASFLSGTSGGRPYALYAADLRASVTVGYTLQERFTPYAVTRFFGGPVFFNGHVGTDVYHFQIGVGLVVGLPKNFDLSLELAPLGEQRVSLGVGYSF